MLKHVCNNLDLFITKFHVSKSFVCSRSKTFSKHLLLFKCLDFNTMNFSHLQSKAPCWLPSPHPQGHLKHVHTSIWARFSSPHGDTSQMLVKGETLTFVGSKHLLQSKHRLFPLNHPQQPSHNCFWPWNYHHLQDGESKNGNNLFCKHFSSKFLLWDLNATILWLATVAVCPHSEVGDALIYIWTTATLQKPNPIPWLVPLFELKFESMVNF